MRGGNLAHALDAVGMRAGYGVISAETGAGTLETLEHARPDLLILDYLLPDNINGLELYRKIKAAGHDLPVILVTAFPQEDVVISALREGVRDFVSKSLHYIDYLPEAVGRVLKQVRTEHLLTERTRLAALSDEVGSALTTSAAPLRASPAT